MNKYEEYEFVFFWILKILKCVWMQCYLASWWFHEDLHTQAGQAKISHRISLRTYLYIMYLYIHIYIYAIYQLPSSMSMGESCGETCGEACGEGWGESCGEACGETCGVAGGDFMGEEGRCGQRFLPSAPSWFRSSSTDLCHSRCLGLQLLQLTKLFMSTTRRLLFFSEESECKS